MQGNIRSRESISKAVSRLFLLLTGKQTIETGLLASLTGWKPIFCVDLLDFSVSSRIQM